MGFTDASTRPADAPKSVTHDPTRPAECPMAAAEARIEPTDPSQCGLVLLQNPAMHCTPLCAPQQSAAVTHFSPSCAHPCGGTHVNATPPSASVDCRQKPLQHSSPVWQSLPFAWHGSSAQKPRMLPDASSCPS